MARAGAGPRRRGRCRGDHGAAVSDFVLVAGLVTVVFVAVFQVGLAMHIRNTLIACASEGARLGARADAEPGQGVARARQLIARSVSGRYARGVTESVVDVGGVRVVEVQVRAPLPVIGPLGPDGWLDVVGRAFAESQ